jgi:hypothetical protein
LNSAAKGSPDTRRTRECALAGLLKDIVERERQHAGYRLDGAPPHQVAVEFLFAGAGTPSPVGGCSAETLNASAWYGSEDDPEEVNVGEPVQPHVVSFDEAQHSRRVAHVAVSTFVTSEELQLSDLVQGSSVLSPTNSVRTPGPGIGPDFPGADCRQRRRQVGRRHRRLAFHA